MESLEIVEWSLNQFFLEGGGDRLGAVGGAELAVGARQIVLDGALGEAENPADFPVGLASAAPPKTFDLARRQAFSPLHGGVSAPAEVHVLAANRHRTRAGFRQDTRGLRPARSSLPRHASLHRDGSVPSRLRARPSTKM